MKKPKRAIIIKGSARKKHEHIVWNFIYDRADKDFGLMRCAGCGITKIP